MKSGQAREHFEICEWGDFRREWQRLFPNIMLLDMYDGLMTFINKYISIDIIALGKRLKLLYPDEWEHMSMEEIIIKHYGEKANKLVKNAI